MPVLRPGAGDVGMEIAGGVASGRMGRSILMLLHW